jgi:hypothetical protein
MICGLLIGREGSVGFPGKNTCLVYGRPLAAYPLMAAKGAKQVHHIYVSTDSPKLKEIGRQYGAEIIDRPADLAAARALGEDVFYHAYTTIRERLRRAGESLELLALLHANSPTVTSDMIEEGIRILRANPEYDSCVSVSKYNMWSPLRARKIDAGGCLRPFVPFEAFGDPKNLSSARDSQGDAWFADMGLSLVRPRCLENMKDGLLPQRWMGQKIFPLRQWGGLDVDYEWQIPHIKNWLRAHGLAKPSRSPKQLVRS